MFSSRFFWDPRPNRCTPLLRRKRRSGGRVLDLTVSNATHAVLHCPPEILGALSDPRALVYEPAPAGAPAARAAVSAWYAARSIEVGADRILLTASTSEAYSYVFKLLADPGGQVLVPRPSYPLFEFLARMESLEVRTYPLRYHGQWSIDVEAVAAEITPLTRAIVLVNPNNPTGSYVKRLEIEALARLGLPLISDEVFSDYA